MPPADLGLLWPPKDRAVLNLEESLAENRPRALIQMATGSGKTLLAAYVSYRLIRYAEAKRILFLVDRANLGRQTLKEFQAFEVPGTGHKFTELYNVQHLASNHIDPVARVTISTIQRLFSTLKGEPELPEELDEESAYDALPDEPVVAARVDRSTDPSEQRTLHWASVLSPDVRHLTCLVERPPQAGARRGMWSAAVATAQVGV